MVAPSVRLHSVTSAKESAGPGRRTVVHFQGCTLGCIGCFSPHTWPAAGGQTLSIDAAAGLIAAHARANGETALTFSGGEPLQQALGVELLWCALKQLRPWAGAGTPDLWVFTGYPLQHPQVARAVFCQEAAQIVAGRYDGPHAGMELARQDMPVRRAALSLNVTTSDITVTGYPRSAL